ncbi:MAG: deoxyribonuclease IV [Promethearchaeota archaeon]
MRLGSHLSVSGGKEKIFENAKTLKCETVQMFVRGVRSWDSKPLEETEIKAFLLKKKEFYGDVHPLLSHNSYLINLARTDEEKLKKSFDAMVDELTKASQLEIDFVVIHPGVIPKDEKDLTIKDALLNISRQLNKLLTKIKKFKATILLETTAGQGSGLGSKFEHIGTIIENIDEKDRIGACFDTSHVFAAGYDFTTESKYDEMWEEFEDKIGLEYLRAFHLNDSETKFSSKIDRHAHIGKGEMGLKPFELLVNDERFKKLPGILETPKSKDYKEDEMNLKTLRNLLHK